MPSASSRRTTTSSAAASIAGRSRRRPLPLGGTGSRSMRDGRSARTRSSSWTQPAREREPVGHGSSGGRGCPETELREEVGALRRHREARRERSKHVVDPRRAEEERRSRPSPLRTRATGVRRRRACTRSPRRPTRRRARGRARRALRERGCVRRAHEHRAPSGRRAPAASARARLRGVCERLAVERDVRPPVNTRWVGRIASPGSSGRDEHREQRGRRRPPPRDATAVS
jgi:hypothetical protein